MLPTESRVLPIPHHGSHAMTSPANGGPGRRASEPRAVRGEEPEPAASQLSQRTQVDALPCVHRTNRLRSRSCRLFPANPMFGEGFLTRSLCPEPRA